MALTLNPTGQPAETWNASLSATSDTTSCDGAQVESAGDTRSAAKPVAEEGSGRQAGQILTFTVCTVPSENWNVSTRVDAPEPTVGSQPASAHWDLMWQ